MTLAQIKRRILEDWLKFKIVQISVSRNLPDVRLPDHLPAVVVLNLSMSFRGEMAIKDDGIDVILSFTGAEFECFIPWGAVLGIAHDQFGSIMFPHSAPKGMGVFLVPMARGALETSEPVAEVGQAPELPEAAGEPPAGQEEPPPQAPDNVVSLFGRKRP